MPPPSEKARDKKVLLLFPDSICQSSRPTPDRPMRTEEDFGEVCKILHMTMGALNRTMENVRTNNAEISTVLVKKTLEIDTRIVHAVWRGRASEV